MNEPIKTFKLTLPAHWANCLFNGVHDSIELAERDIIEKMENEYDLRCPLSSEPAGFKRYHDATPYGVLPCDCEEYTFPILRSK